jgi:3-hydroxybutyryl-CoA dehydratase
MTKKNFEDFALNERFFTEARTITETDVVSFVNLAAWHIPMFTDMEYIKQKTVLKERIVPGILVVSIALGQFSRLALAHAEVLAMAGIQIKFSIPVTPGDTIRSEVHVVSRKESKKGDRGTVEFHYRVLNQKDQVVAEMNEMVLLKKK